MRVLSGYQARPQQPTPQGLFQRLIKIKYSAELYLINAQKNQSKLKVERVETNSLDKLKKEDYESLDSALAIYNTIRWNVDGLVYQLSGDLVAANSPKKLRRLNDWCLKQRNYIHIWKHASFFHFFDFSINNFIQQTKHSVSISKASFLKLLV